MIAGTRPIGLRFSPASVEEALGLVRRADADGFHWASFPNSFGPDALTLCAVVGNTVLREGGNGIALACFVMPTYPRHPVVMAQQAIATHDACGGRFMLGVGASHPLVIEQRMGLEYKAPARHMREYLAVIVPLLERGEVSFGGEEYRVETQLERTFEHGPPVLVAALGPLMLKVAGTLADGTVTGLTGHRTIASYLAPAIRSAAEDAGRPAPHIVAGVPVCVTDDVRRARAAVNDFFVVHRGLANYRQVMGREGVDEPADVSLIGDETTVEEGVQAFFEAGATHFDARLLGTPDEVERGWELLRSLL